MTYIRDKETHAVWQNQSVADSEIRIWVSR